EAAALLREDARRVDRLLHDLVCLQVAPKRELAGRAKRTADRTTSLRGDAKRGAVCIAHDDRLHRVAAVELEEGLGGETAVGLRDRDRPERGRTKGGVERTPQRLRDVNHGLKGGGPTSEPIPDLLAPIGGRALIGAPLLELGGGPGEERPGRRDE